MTESEPQLIIDPVRGRIIAGIAVAGSLAMLVVNDLGAESGRVSLLPLFFGPLVLMLGLGGLIDPRVLWSVGPRGRQLPVGLRIIGGGLAALGLLISAGLALFVYRLA